MKGALQATRDPDVQPYVPNNNVGKQGKCGEAKLSTRQTRCWSVVKRARSKIKARQM